MKIQKLLLVVLVCLLVAAVTLYGTLLWRANSQDSQQVVAKPKSITEEKSLAATLRSTYKKSLNDKWKELQKLPIPDAERRKRMIQFHTLAVEEFDAVERSRYKKQFQVKFE